MPSEYTLLAIIAACVATMCIPATFSAVVISYIYLKEIFRR
jgi:hypothetical protein